MKVKNKRGGSIELLGYKEKISYTVNKRGQLTINMPGLNLNEQPGEHAYTFKLIGFEFAD